MFYLDKDLPGQRDAAQLWSDFFAEMLEKYGMTRCISSPTLFRKMIDAMVVMVLVVHVDDLQIAGEQEESNKLISDLSTVICQKKQSYRKKDRFSLEKKEKEVGRQEACDSSKESLSTRMRSFSSTLTRNTSASYVRL